MSYSTLWVSTNSGTIQNVFTPRFSTGPHDRSTKNTWNGSSQRELNHKSAVRNVRGRSVGVEHRPFSRHYIKRRLQTTTTVAGLTSSTGEPLTFPPHAINRIFLPT